MPPLPTADFAIAIHFVDPKAQTSVPMEERVTFNGLHDLMDSEITREIETGEPVLGT